MTISYISAMSTEESILTYLDIILNNDAPMVVINALFNDAITRSYLKVLEKILASKKIEINSEYYQSMREITNPGVAKLLLLDERIDLDNAAYQFYLACHRGYDDIVKIFLNDEKFNICKSTYYSFSVAAQNNHFETVKLLLDSKKDFIENDFNDAIAQVSRSGKLEMVKLLLTDKRINPSSNKNLSIRVASLGGHIEIVKLLLSDTRVNPCDSDNGAIILAMSNNHVDVVKLLIPYVDLKFINNPAIHKIAEEMKPKEKSGWYEAFGSLMDEYHIKSIFMEHGKECRVTFDS